MTTIADAAISSALAGTARDSAYIVAGVGADEPVSLDYAEQQPQQGRRFCVVVAGGDWLA